MLLDDDGAAKNVGGRRGETEQDTEEDGMHVAGGSYQFSVRVPCPQLCCRPLSSQFRKNFRSAAMPDMHHVAILHDVVLAFEAQRAFGAGVGFGAGFEQLVPADGFSADEMLLQIGVDGAGGFDGAGADRNGPGAAFVFAGGEE